MKKIYAFFLLLLAINFATQGQTVIPSSDELILPQYAYYGGTNPASRMPFVCRLKLTGLTPGATYRYFTGMSSNAAAATQTPGNMYRINNGLSVAGYGYITGFAVTKAINSTEINNDEMRTDNVSRHGRLTADGSGTYTGWFACVPVGNATQQAVGSNVHFYVQVNDGGSGTALAQSFRTTSTVKLLDYSTVAGDPNGCTALLGTSDVDDEKMVMIYDNEAGIGRPLYGTFTENNNQGGSLNEGTLWTNPVLYPAVDGVTGSWAAIIPNTLTGGVKAINFLNIPDAGIIPLSNAPGPNTSADGTWNDVATANPVGGADAPIKINSIARSGSLPVNLLSFKGEAAKEGVRLHWETTQEINNKYFEVSRAGDGGIFRTIGSVNAVALSALTNRYDLTDYHPLPGNNYYQLRQVDQDGRSRVYNTILVKFGSPANGLRLISSGGNEMVVSVSASEPKNGRIVHIDILGHVLSDQPVMVREGENIIRIPVRSSASKISVISFVANGERMHLKVLR